MTLERHPDASTVLTIEGDMNIYRAAELKQLLVTAAENATVVHVDLCDVTELDSAGVQLLLLARQNGRDTAARVPGRESQCRPCAKC